jgi:fumarate reductase subunit C
MHGPTTHQPASYLPRLPADWWLKNPRYFLFMVRELSAVFAALWVVIFLTQIPLMAGGPEAHAQWLATIRSPAWIVFSLVSLAFVLYHAVTWFKVMGFSIYLRTGKSPITGATVVAPVVVVWAVASVVIAYVLAWPGIGR